MIARTPMLRVLLFLITVSGCGPPRGDSQIHVQLNWYPDAQFGGYYAALLHGEYAAEGLDVRIIGGGPDVTVMPKLAMGRVDFAIGNADQVLLARKEGADIVAVMASMQDSPRCIMVHESSGIRSLDQLANVTLAIGEGNPFAEYLKARVPLTDVRLVSYSGSIAKFLIDNRFAQQGYVFSEPILARQKGADPLSLMMSDLGFNPYTGVVVARTERIKQNPDMIRRFVKATIRGWQRYLRDPQLTNEELCRLNPEMDLDTLEQAVAAIKPLCVPEGHDESIIGHMTRQRWEQLAGQLMELGLLPKSGTSAAEAFRTEFLP